VKVVNEPSDSIKGRAFLEQQSDYQLLKDSAPCRVCLNLYKSCHICFKGRERELLNCKNKFLGPVTYKGFA